MMKLFARRKWVVMAACMFGLAANIAAADWHQFWHQFHVDRHRSSAWPAPFNEVDALQVAAPFEIMKHNGWRAHNTIGNDLFREGDGALLAAGSNCVYWIATQAPDSRRTVYVLRGKSQEETNARVDSVRQTLAGIHMTGPMPEVIITEKEPPTASGAWAVRINRDWMEVIPKPKLPNRTVQGGDGAAEQ